MRKKLHKNRPQTSSATVNGNFFKVFSVSKIIGFRKTFLALVGKLRSKTKEDELWIQVAEDLEQLKLESKEKSLRIAALERKTQKLEDDLKMRDERILGLEADIESVETDKKNRIIYSKNRLKLIMCWLPIRRRLLITRSLEKIRRK
jgi:hypothetical protein